jgi:phage antirepressor YoqD-like protein
MAKISKSEHEKYLNEHSAKKSEEIRLVVPKVVASTFRQVAKKAKMSTAELFEEMVEAHAAGMSFPTKKK